MRNLTIDTEKMNSLKFASPLSDDFYSATLAKKTEWQPAAGSINDIRQTSGIPETLQKCMALALALELPVGDMIGNVLDFSDLGLRTLKDSQVALLADNALDELVHFKAFSAYEGWAQAYNEEANQITEAIMDYAKDQPLFTAGYVELGIFFPVLGLLRKYGNSAIQLMSGYVSRDEAAHVRTNWTIIDDQRLGVRQDLTGLQNIRRDVISWLAGSLTVLGSKKDYWISQSDKLIDTRKSDMMFTKPAQYTAFFEVPNTSLGVY